MKVVEIHDRPPVDDIVAQLRRLADRFEQGYHKAPYVMLLTPSDSQLDWCTVQLFGRDPGDLERTGLIAQAQAFMTIHKVARTR